MRALDDDYRTFFELVATQIASGLADAQALEDERRRAEALAELDRAKTTFFSNVVARVPHAADADDRPARGSAGQRQRPLAGGRSRARWTSRTATACGCSKLVNTLLDFSRIEAGRIDASYEPTDLAALTADLASVFRSAIEKAGLAARRRLPSAARARLRRPRHVGEDRPQPALERVQVHVRRAKSRWHCGGSGTASSFASATPASAFRESELPRVFERFHRVKNARARTHEGTGIGLALVQELARLHGGTVASRAAKAAARRSR